MNDKNQEDNNILICGSQSFDLDLFAENIMENLFSNFQKKGSPIKQIYTSQYSGACSIVKSWMQKKNEYLSLIGEPLIKQKDYSFTLFNNSNTHSMYEDLVIPDFILENDEMFQIGKEKIQSFNLNFIVVFPNQEGIIGAHSRNIIRFAELAGFSKNINIMDCSDFLKDYLIRFENKYPTAEDKQNAESIISQRKNLTPDSSFNLGFKNHHKGKTFR